VFGSQATIYAIRDRRHLWGSRPSVWLAASSAADVLIASILAVGGIAMTPLPARVVVGTLAAASALAFVLDVAKNSDIRSPQDRLMRTSSSPINEHVGAIAREIEISFRGDHDTLVHQW
jgi:hypothetical protein